jgi:hypothetical protein
VGKVFNKLAEARVITIIDGLSSRIIDGLSPVRRAA